MSEQQTEQLLRKVIEEKSQNKKNLMIFMNTYMLACNKEKDIPEESKEIWLEARNYFSQLKKIKFQKLNGSSVILNNRILTNIFNSKVFIIDDKIVNSLWFTNNELKRIYPPFKSIFLDVNIKLNDYQNVCGILLFNDDKENIKSYNLTFVVTCTQGENFEQNFVIQSYMVGEDELNDLNGIKTELYKKLVNFTQSFLNFIYNPEVEIVKKEYSPIRIKRKAQQGKIVKNHYYLKLKGKVRIYIDNLNDEVSKVEYQRYIDSWLVRGYYRNLTSNFWKSKRGQKIFVPSFVKGIEKQELDKYDKKYILSKKKEWFNEMYMTFLIRKIFPQYITLENTRGILNRLELDCYIPDLKLGFEYDGEQHYIFPNSFHKSKEDFKEQLRRDREKDRLCKEMGIKLIRIKYDETMTEDLIKDKTGGANDERK